MHLRALLVPAAAAALCLLAPGLVEAQSVVVQGQVQVQPYGQPQGVPQAPPGYGVQGQGQVYVQPQPQQPTYAPTYQAYQPPQRQIRYVDRETSIKALWIPGIILFGVSYALTATFTNAIVYSASDDYYVWNSIPLIGPWVALGYANSDDETTGSLIGGIAQVAGLAMFILGLTLRRTVRVAQYALDEDPRGPSLAVDVLPSPGGGRLGLTLSHF